MTSGVAERPTRQRQDSPSPNESMRQILYSSLNCASVIPSIIMLVPSGTRLKAQDITPYQLLMCKINLVRRSSYEIHSSFASFSSFDTPCFASSIIRLLNIILSKPNLSYTECCSSIFVKRMKPSKFLPLLWRDGPRSQLSNERPQTLAACTRVP